MRYLLLVIGSMIFLSGISASPSPYDVALERIQDAALVGATTLGLTDLGLTSLPPEIGQLNRLEELYLDRNQLTALPPEIGQLTALRWLYINDNHLASLPSEIGQLRHLTWLYLNNNQFSSLPPEIRNLSALKILMLNNNRLTSLSSPLPTHLCYLDLRRNPIEILPDELYGWTPSCPDTTSGFYHDNVPFEVTKTATPFYLPEVTHEPTPTTDYFSPTLTQLAKFGPEMTHRAQLRFRVEVTPEVFPVYGGMYTNPPIKDNDNFLRVTLSVVFIGTLFLARWVKNRGEKRKKI
jgi:hypothetical protein